MKQYFTKFDPSDIVVDKIKGEGLGFNKGDSFRLQDYIPKGLCPLAYYNLIPYAITLSYGGWFGWVKKQKNLNARINFDNTDFSKTSINQRFPNEVIVQCPNPNVGVVFGVGPVHQGGEKNILIRVIGKAKDCCDGLKESDRFILSKQQILESSLVAKLFPYWLANSISEKAPVLSEGEKQYYVFKHNNGFLKLYFAHQTKQPLICSSACSSSNRFFIQISNLKSKCRFHADDFKRFDHQSIFIPNMCPEAFTAAYLHGIAKAYGAMFETRFSCSKWDGVDFEVVAEMRRPWAVTKFIKLLLFLSRKVNFPHDILTEKIFLKVSHVRHCPYKHQNGQRYELNLFDVSILCPASAYSLFWFYFLKQNSLSIDWGKRKNEIACPDCAGCEYIVKEKFKRM